MIGEIISWLVWISHITLLVWAWCAGCAAYSEVSQLRAKLFKLERDQDLLHAHNRHLESKIENQYQAHIN